MNERIIARRGKRNTTLPRKRAINKLTWKRGRKKFPSEQAKGIMGEESAAISILKGASSGIHSRAKERKKNADKLKLIVY